MNRSIVLFALTAAFVAAGCLETNAPVADPDQGTIGNFLPEVSPDRLPIPDFDFTTAIDPDHGGIPGGHSRRDLHQGNFGLELVGYNPLTGIENGVAPTTQDVAYTAVNSWGTYACASYFPTAGGAAIIDIADPTTPTVLSVFDSGMANWHCDFSPDGNYLFITAYQGVRPGDAALPLPAGDLAATGVSVFNVADKSNPTFLFHDDTGADQQATHAPFFLDIGGKTYMVHSYTGHILEFKPADLTFEIVATMEHSGHDVWAGRHPVTGDHVVIQGSGCDTAVYNVNDPAHPVELGFWSADDARAQGWADSCADHWRWPVMGTVGGHAYFVVVGADLSGGTIPFNVLDWTDPSHIVQVSAWWMPGDPQSPEPNFYTFGGTEYDTWDGYVVAGIMHAGIWVFDIGSPERALDPATLGYYLPAEDPVEHGGLWNKPFAFSPLVWAAVFDDRGYVLASDTSTGFYVLKFGATQVDPAAMGHAEHA